jgi:tetratricopeptide (TPR) repeat protein
MAAWNHEGYYEDALRHAGEVHASLPREGAGPHFLSRWGVISAVFYAYIINGRAADGLALLEETLPSLGEPRDRARALYQMSMLHARYLPERDLAQAEAYLRAAMDEVERDTAPGGDDRHFMRVFLDNGLALVRHRQGRAADAVSLTRDGFDHLEANLADGRHQLHRSVLLYNAAQVFASTGAIDEALRGYSAAIAMDPFYSEYYNERGSLYLRAGRHAEAMDDYLRAIEFASPYPEVWVNLGQCHALLGRWADACAAYERAVDLDPGRFLAHVGLARALAALGEPARAVAAYDAALALDPAHPLLYANRAALHFGLGDAGAALADLDRAIEGEPGNAALLRNRALALRALGRHAHADADLAHAARLEPAASPEAALQPA